MAFSSATNLSEKKEKHRIERVLAAYQDAVDHEEADREVAQILNDSTSLVDSDERNENSKSSSPHQWLSWRCPKISWQELQFAAFYFLTGCAPAMLLPYLSVYYRQLGLDSHEIGLVKSLQPWIAIPAIPLWGYFADRFRVTRFLFMFSLMGYLVCNVALAFTPKVDEVDCQTAISRICEDPKSIITHETPERFEPVTAFHSSYLETSSTNTSSHLSIDATKLCLPRGQYVGYFYEMDELLRLFIYLIIINIIGEIWQAPTPALGNAVVLNGLGKDKRHYYGYYKAFGALGAAIGVFISGQAVDHTEQSYERCGIELSRVNYAACFISFAACVIIVLPIAWSMDNSTSKDDEKRAKEYHFRDVIVALATIRYGSAFLAITWLSISVGVQKTFDFWYIEILGGSHSMMGWMGMIGTLVLVATFLMLPYLNNRFGYLPFLVLALVATGIGCSISAFITNPWWMTLSMSLRGLATATSAQSAGAYLADAVDKNHMATLQTIMAAIIYGVGNGAGSLLGGILLKAWSPLICYLVFGIASFVFSGLLTVSSLC